MTSSTNIQEIRQDFIEKTGLLGQAEGLPRTAGRALGMLIFDGELVSFGEISTRLQVSRASVSTSIRLLEERGLVKRSNKPGERQDFFQLATDPYVTMLETFMKRNCAMRDDIAQTINSLPKDCGAVERLKDFSDFYETMDYSVSIALKKLIESREERNRTNADGQKDQMNGY